VKSIIVMGVSGCGKTTFGSALAARVRLDFIEGDQLHPPENIAKMSAGIPLTDDDRWPWLSSISDALAARRAAVASCSALRRIYRDRLREGAGGELIFICLVLPKTELERRMTLRTGHFMPAGLLDSQLAAFESPQDEAGVLMVDGALVQDSNLDRATAWLGGNLWEKVS
jgi:gluconokinase